jgi:hypothetical protein
VVRVQFALCGCVLHDVSPSIDVSPVEMRLFQQSHFNR